MGYSGSEEEFLGAYLAYKLQNGGEPVITQNELKSVLNKFINSIYYMGNLSHIKKFNFDNLQTLSEKYYQKAKVNCSWRKPCFAYKEGKLYPTYDFYDISQTTYGEFLAFLHDERYKTFTKHYVNAENLNIDKKYIMQGKIVAKFLTKVYAQKYIEKEVKNGRWPSHMQNISYLLNKDLGSVLNLKGTKEYFKKFYNYSSLVVAKLLAENNGKLILSDKKYGDLKYNNLKIILNKFPLLDNLCGEFYEKNESKFDMFIDGETIKCNSTTLKFSDPYGNFSDFYTNNEIILSK